MTARSATGGSSSDGVQLSRFAYSAKKRYVLASVSNTRRAASPRADGSNRFGSHGWLDRQEVPADGIDAEALDGRPRVHHVAPRLRHLLALRVEDQVVDQHVAERRTRSSIVEMAMSE
jgi:hypothetical protein